MTNFIQSTGVGKPLYPAANVIKIVPRRKKDYAVVHQRDAKTPTYRIAWETYLALIGEKGAA
jgi:hypothetical protein